MIKFGFCCNIEDAKKFSSDGFDYFESSVGNALIPDRDDEAWEAQKHLLSEIELPLYACNGFLPGTMRLTGPNANHNPALDYAERACRRADEIGCRYIVLGSGGARNIPGDFLDPAKKPDIEGGYAQFTEFCRTLAKRIADCRVTVVLEPLRPNESNLLNYVWQGMQIVNDIDSPRIEVLADIFHMMQGRESAASIVAAGQHIKHCHVAMSGTRAWPGYAPAFELAPYFEALDKIGYSGGISCECGWPLHEGQTIFDAHREAVATMRNLAARP